MFRLADQIEKNKNRIGKSVILVVVSACIYMILRVISIGENGIVYISSCDIQRLSRNCHEPVDSIDRHIRFRIQVLPVQQAKYVATIWENAARQNKIRLDSVVYYLIPKAAEQPTDVAGIRGFSLDGRIYQVPQMFHSSLPGVLFGEMNRFCSSRVGSKDNEDEFYSCHYANPIEILRIIGDQQLTEVYYGLSSGDKYLFEFLHNAMLCDNHLTSFRMCLNFCEMLLCCVWLYVGLRQCYPTYLILDDNIITIKNSLIDSLDESQNEHNLNGRLKKEYSIFKNSAIAYYLNSIDAMDIDMDSSYSFCQVAELLHYIRVRVDHSNAYTPRNKHAAWSTVATIAFILCEILDLQHFRIQIEEQNVYIGYENDLIPTIKDGLNLIRNNLGHPEFARMHCGKIQYFDFYAGNYIIPEIKD